jgi:hypothetical protein
VQVTGLSDITMIAAGYYHSLAIKGDGSVWAWGSNSYGQLGYGTITNRSTPVQVTGLSNATSIAAGDYHSLAIKNDGTVWSWGDNKAAQLGYGYPTYVPEAVYSEIHCQPKTFTTSHSTTIMIPVINVAQKETTFSFTTIDSTAISGIDYIHTTGTLSFQANESQKDIPVTILNNQVNNHTEKTFMLNIEASDDIFLNNASQAIITILSGNSVHTPYLQTFTQSLPGNGWTYYSSETTGRIQQTADCLRMDSSQDNTTALNEAIKALIHNAPPCIFVEIITNNCIWDVGTSLDIPFLLKDNRFFSLNKALILSNLIV